ncbi:MAG: DUF2339 domain-containing protein [Pyrinomonadaceae bacterium]|nr:DUF2339 domain-containing protein [Pyrinomonadaceae bacterium]
MADSSEKINRLQARLDKMVEYQDYFYREINQIRDELKSLKTDKQSETPPPPIIEEEFQPPKSDTKPFPRPPIERQKQSENTNYETAQVSPAPRQSSNIEEFVGRNLISLVGIIITILGVGIGAKYAIDRDLISPATRILLGYAFAGLLFAVAFWLKKKYLNFSAVLLSGALAIMYFLTFFAYSFYGLIPQSAAFALMLFFTAFTVGAAINFNRQVIAHIGLVGAYAVPFLLSDNSGNAFVLFGYMTIINFGILAISIVKFWKPLFYSSFIFTWLIYAAWYLSSYRAAEHFALAFGFAVVFFLTFYLTFLVYKLRAEEEFSAEIVVLVVVNSFIFFGFGYAILDSRENYEWLLGLFAVANALLNGALAFIIHRYNPLDRKNFYLAVALAVTFATIAVPVQFRGNWITLIWTAEAAILFWIGRTKKLSIYENLSYPLMLLASVSLLNDWQNAFNNQTILTPIFNQNFLTSVLLAVAFGFITFVNRDKTYQPANENISNLLNFAAPTIFLFALYNAFRVEIGNYYHLQLLKSGERFLPEVLNDDNLTKFSLIWQINYSLLFLTILSFVNIKKIKSAWLGLINLALNSLILFAFLSVSLYLLGELRESYLAQTDAQMFERGIFHILIRYVSFAFVAALIYAAYEYIKQQFLEELVSNSALDFAFDFVFYVALWWLASSELINLMDISGFNDSYKLGLSILWGIYSLLLIVLGIIKQKKHLRVGAIVLFTVTLIKLFFYDIADLDTISKTVIFVTLGVLLLIISFLYNKYKDLIFDKSAEQ